LKTDRNYSWLHILHSAAIVGIDTRTSTSHPGRRLGSSGWSGITKAVMPDERLSWVCPTSSAHSHAYDRRAHIYEALGRKEEALADFRKALALNPTIQTSQEGLTRLRATPLTVASGLREAQATTSLRVQRYLGVCGEAVGRANQRSLIGQSLLCSLRPPN
jgi:tetratricopeptide (TPR) repeat protein